MTYTYIESDKSLIRFRAKLQSENITAVCMDFEGEFNLHCYGERLCLIQVFDGRHFYVIDPFHISREELKKTLESDVVKLFYSAGSDQKLAYGQYGIRIRALLDIAHLAEVIHLPHRSLSSVVEELLAVTVEKKKKYQRHNWTLRPISEDAVQYALFDVKYLFDLKDVLLKRIKEKNLLEALAYHLAKAEFDYEKKSVPGIKKKPRYFKLNQAARRTFDVVFDIREQYARTLDKPPNSVISNEQLFEIAEKKRNLTRIDFGKRVPDRVRKGMRQEIAETLPRILENPARKANHA